MSAVRKIAVSAAALFLGLSALSVSAAPALAESRTVSSFECDNDWHTPIPSPCP